MIQGPEVSSMPCFDYHNMSLLLPKKCRKVTHVIPSVCFRISMPREFTALAVTLCRNVHYVQLFSCRLTLETFRVDPWKNLVIWDVTLCKLDIGLKVSE